MVERKKALHTQVAAAQNLLVQVGAKFLKILQAIGHGSSGNLGAKAGRCVRYYAMIYARQEHRKQHRQKDGLANSQATGV